MRHKNASDYIQTRLDKIFTALGLALKEHQPTELVRQQLFIEL